MHHFCKRWGQSFDDFFPDVFRHAVVICFCDASCDGSHGVGVASQGDGQADGAFVVRAFQKGGDGFGHTALAGCVETVAGAYFVAGTVEVVAESGLDVFLDFCLALSCAGQVDGGCRCLCPFDSFRMVVGDFRASLGCLQCLFQCAECPSYGADAHGRTVAVAVVGLRVAFAQPSGEHSAVAGVCIAVAVVLHDERQAVFCPGSSYVSARVACQQPVGVGDGHDRVVRKSGGGAEQGEVGCLDAVEFIDGTDDVARDGSQQDAAVVFVPHKSFFLIV